MVMTAADISQRFVERRKSYIEFEDCTKQLIQTILKEHRITVQSTTGRVKEVESLTGKLQRKPHQYTQLEDITDLVGLRVTVYLPEDVDRVAALIDSEFCIDGINSVDKRSFSDPGRFGYVSLHKVCSLSSERVKLSEYRKYSGLKCEIQIRTVLQHAWAEIEHDLGYKSSEGLPEPLKRRFCRIAALLETADEEFMRLKADIDQHILQAREKAAKAMPGTLLDRDTLNAFIHENTLLQAIESVIARLQEPSPSMLDSHLNNLRLLGIEHVDSLAGAIKRHQDHVAKGSARCAEVDYGYPSEQCEQVGEKGWSLWMLAQLLCAEKPTEEETLQAFRMIGLCIGDSLDAYAKSLRLIVRDVDMSNRKVDTYGSVYLTITYNFGSGVGTGSGAGDVTFPMTFKNGKWVWDNVALTNSGLVIEGKTYAIQSRNPLSAQANHKGKEFLVTE